MDNQYAPIDSTEWTLDRPARSTVRGSGHKFTHEIGCPVQGSYQDCICYVSRIRLVVTPAGDFLPTTDPDLAPELVFWEARARHWERQAWIARGLFLAMGIAGAVVGAL